MRRLYTGFCLFLGVVCMAAGVGAFINAAPKIAREFTPHAYLQAEGVVLTVSEGRPTVEFQTAAGTFIRFEGPGVTKRIRRTSYELGQRVAVSYDPQRVEMAMIGSYRIKLLEQTGIGLVFAVVGSGVGFFTLRRFRRIKRLLRNGQRIDGVVTDTVY